MQPDCTKCKYFKDSGSVGYAYCEFWDDKLSKKTKIFKRSTDCTAFEEINN